MSFELTVGLETHVELSTKTKIFCSCRTDFGALPNSQVCPVCLGLPGTLPRLNGRAVEYAVKAGLAMNCRVNNNSRMARKNYMYPDLPKAYQITQGEYPICESGYMDLSDGHRVRIKRIHIEEDAGKLVHSGDKTLIDYNRSGVPLIEIVTEPDFHSSRQVKEYLENLRLIMKTIGISDCKMQEGSMRCDVNISVKRNGDTKPGTKTEIKNMSSFSFIEKAIESEFSRQIKLIEKGEKIAGETRRYNEKTKETESMRKKEESEDYRCFPEPDLPGAYISPQKVEELRKSLPELPQNKMQRYCSDYRLSPSDSMQIIKYPNIASYFEKVVEICKNPTLSANIIFSYFYKILPDEESRENGDVGISAEAVGEVLKYVCAGEIGKNFIPEILDKMIAEGRKFEQLFSAGDFTAIRQEEVERLAEKAIEENPKAVKDYLEGKDRAIAVIIGSVMKQSKGKANPERVKEIILKKIM